MKKTCAFFGHRSIPDNLEPRLRAQIISAIEQQGVTEFWNGCYGGFDALAAEIVISLKPSYPHIRLRQVYAYPPYSNSLRKGFDGAFCPDGLEACSDKARIPRRNIWMAKNCDMVIAYVEHNGSRIHEPLDHVHASKAIINLGSYQPRLSAYPD